MAENFIVLPYTDNLKVSSNELFLRETINRNLEKFLANDLYLLNKINSYGTSEIFSIQPYKKDYVYGAGDVVVYIDYKNGKIDNIYLLESLVDNNDTEPSYEIVNGFVADFSDSGWKNLNNFFSIYNSSNAEINLSTFLDYSISSKFSLSHESDLSYHKFGEIHKDTIIDKLLKKDFSNVADDRKNLFWSYETKKVESNNFSGWYKKWGNGVIEYDLTYCLGDNLKVEKTINQDGSITTTNYINANSFIPENSEECTNEDYFLNEDSRSIFNKNGTSKKYNINGIAQTNINQQVNEYHGTIVFPIPFIDDKYMVFTSGRSRDANGKVQSPNTITFANRKKNSITAIFVIPNYNNVEIETVLLKKNVFQCQIIGRWK